MTYGEASGLPRSNRTESCRRTVIKTFEDAQGVPREMAITFRWDDCCRNGFNLFSVTALEYDPLRGASSGVIAGSDLVASVAPELAFALPYHLVSAIGPLHYLANTVYLAGDRDFRGLRAGEQRVNEAGLPVWKLAEMPYTHVYAERLPQALRFAYSPLHGTGKARDLIAARELLGMPGTLSDEELSRDEAGLKEALERHGVTLDSTTLQNIVYLAGNRDFHGCKAGEQRKNDDGLLLWKCDHPLAAVVASPVKPQDIVVPFVAVVGEGKQRELDLARQAAHWPDASDEDLLVPSEELERKLRERLPAFMLEFKSVIERLGFEY